jgi:hypothetical protein
MQLVHISIVEFRKWRGVRDTTLSDKVWIQFVSGFRMIGGFFDYSKCLSPYKTVVNHISEILFYSQCLCNLFFFPNSCHFLILKFLLFA